MGTPMIATIVSAILLILGYLIAVRKQMNLISGYDPEKVSDPDGLANWIGGWCLVLGGVTLVMGWGVYVYRDYTLDLVKGLSTVILVACLVMALGTRRFKNLQ